MGALFQRHFFLLGIGLMVGLAWVFPASDAFSDAVLQPMSQWGIAGIFVIYGWRLHWDDLAQKLLNWKLHASVQAITFIVFPLIGAGLYVGLKQTPLAPLREALFFASILPSTVSFSVMMTSLARGNVPAAIFNASLSGMLGVLMVPLGLQWIGIPFIENQSLVEIYGRLILQILVPVAVGVASQRWITRRIPMDAWGIKNFDKMIIWVIVFKSFQAHFHGSSTIGIPYGHTAVLAIGAAGMYFIMLGIASWWARVIRLNREDAIALKMCGITKSLVHGTAMAAVLFEEERVPQMLLGILFYHGIALFTTSFLAERWGRVAAD